jgi:hypothetical protein
MFCLLLGIGIPMFCLLQSERCVQFHLYLQTLPKRVDLPYFWTPDEVASLQSPHLQNRIAEQREEWQGFWQQVRKAAGTHRITQQDLEWALSCVVSRSFKGPYIASSGKVCPWKYFSCMFRGFHIAPYWHGLWTVLSWNPGSKLAELPACTGSLNGT